MSHSSIERKLEKLEQAAGTDNHEVVFASFIDTDPDSDEAQSQPSGVYIDENGTKRIVINLNDS